MADVTKITYVSPERLGYYDSKIKAYLKAQDDAIKAEVDELAGKIGEVAEGKTVMGIIDEIQKAAYDDTELRGLIGDNADAIDEIEKDYLKAADKKELQDQITENAEAIELLTNGVDTETIDGVNDLIKYVNDHGTEVTGMKADIKANADWIAEHKEVDHDFAAADTALKNELNAEIAKKADATALDEVSDKVADIETALGAEGTTGKAIAELEAAVATKAENADLEALEGVVSGKAEASVVEGISGKVTTLEGQVATKAEASVVEELTETVNGKADAQTVTDLANAVGTPDEGKTVVGMIDDAEARIEALEAIEHAEIETSYIDRLFAEATE